MANILQTIAEATRKRVAAKKVQLPLEAVAQRAREMAEAERAAAGGFDFPFRAALAQPGLSFICEVKKASPSKGLIAPDFPYLAIARDYERAGAAAISCLTEPQWFLGGDRYLAEIAADVSIPVLRKDFVVDEYMVYEAKMLGASAVLLIASILDDSQLAEYLKIAHSLGLSVLAEAHDAEEVKCVLAAGAGIVGVNNRNLADFSVDFANAQKLRALIPDDVIYVAESGVSAPADAAAVAAGGADAVLIGEALMRATDKTATLAAFKEAAAEAVPVSEGACGAGAASPTAMKVKFCGLSQMEDVAAMNRMRPDYVGFVFWPSSKRVVSADEARELRAALDDAIATVGVFVDEDPAVIVELAAVGIISVAQLHGSEDEAYIKGLRARAEARGISDLEVWKTFLCREADDAALPLDAIAESSADLVLIDAGLGEGRSFDWSALKAIDRPFALAGGLSPDNAASIPHALSAHLPAVVDVSSGIEAEEGPPGARPRKSEAKMRAFMAALGRNP